MQIYLDNAATTPIDPQVLEAMMPYFTEHYGNPSAIHGFGRKTRAAIEKARKTVANAINGSTGEIFFTSGGTESNNMAIKCGVEELGVKRIITSPIEHHCVLHTIEYLAETGKVTVDMVRLDKYGRADLNHLALLLNDSSEKTMVSLMHANNEVGTLNNLRKISDLCAEHGVYLHSDTVQTIGHFPLNLQELNIHFLSGSAHKFHGPKGCGFIYINGEVALKPYIHGGGQERNMRAGTENVYGIVGLAKALEMALANMEEHRNHIVSLRNHLRQQLEQQIEGVQFNGDYDGDYLYTVLNVSLPASEMGDMLIYNLDIAGIACSAGSACSSGSNTGSHVLKTLDVDPDRTNIRFSFSKFNTIEEIDFVVSKLKELYPAAVKI